jgi:aspartate/methionine/tyrosine aminotransferase
MKPANDILSGYGTTIFTVMSALAQEHGAINLGQGFPDEDGPEDVRRAAAAALLSGSNQYPPMLGLPELRQAVARHNRRFYGLDVDWRTQVMVTSGATEALADAILGLVGPGDEVVLIEPLYDSYLPIVRRAGGVARSVRLEPPDWALPRSDLAAAFSSRTKLLILNSPHNPSGKVFSEDELQFIAGLIEEADAYALCDEVYEHLVFDGHRHRPLMTLPGMAERCLRVGSAGKTFSVTGWKVGYLTGPPPLIEACARAHQFVTFTTAPNLQKGVAYGLERDDAYFARLAATQADKRDRLSRGLARIGFKVLPAAGTYFLSADIGEMARGQPDEAFCRRMTTEAGVAAVPLSAFYRDAGPDHFIRFCFCKQDSVLDEACLRLARYFRDS